MKVYKLVDKKPVLCDNDDYQSFDFDSNRSIAKTTLDDGTYISTVFLCFDHQFGDGPPLLFETMVFSEHGSWAEEDMDRYSTYEDAVEGHRRMVEKHGGIVRPKDFFDDNLFLL